MNRDCFSYRLFQRLMTFALICLTWVFFRAESLEAAMIVLRQMFSVHNPWIFFDETLYTLGLSRLELGLLVASAAVVLAVDVAHEHGRDAQKASGTAEPGLSVVGLSRGDPLYPYFWRVWPRL